MHMVTANDLLILFVVLPCNISFVMIGDKDASLMLLPQSTLPLCEPAVDEHGLGWPAPPNVRSSVERIYEHVTHESLRGNLPNQLATAACGIHR